MLAKVYSATAIGLQTITIEVEVNVGKGKPIISIVGLPNKAVQESDQRVKTALRNLGIRFPAVRITINLAPADILKEGAIFDLPMAVGILHALGEISLPKNHTMMFIGELALDGRIRPVKGVLPFVLHARKQKAVGIVIPEENKKEVEIISGVKIHPISSLRQLIDHYLGISPMPVLETKQFSEEMVSQFDIDFADVHGQETAKRALEIAAAGGHNVLMNGSPGSGKSMMAKAMVSILPPLTEREAIEVTKIYSVSGLTQTGLVAVRPFRSPHHTTSQVGLIGGGTKLKPGEISLAHRGILFLDEFPEFSHQALESLRQPLEDHLVQISRASGSISYPAQFMLVAAANPCPCGHRLSKNKQCHCGQFQIDRYEKKLSGPILDRIDLHVIVQEVEVEKLAKANSVTQEKSETIRRRVIEARKIQNLRYKSSKFLMNCELSSQAVKKYCQMTKDAEVLLHQAIKKYGLSARSYFKVIKVAQTIADLAQQKQIEVNHIAESLQYRPS